MEKTKYFFEYCLSKATLQWLVAIKILTPIEAKEIDELNRVGFEIGEDVEKIRI